MTTVKLPMDDWKTIPWRKVERNVFKLQKRIYRASLKGEQRTVHKCCWCGLYFRTDDRLEIDHIQPRIQGGKDVKANRQLLHRIVMTVKPPKIEVRMKGAGFTRSRMTGNCHVRF